MQHPFITSLNDKSLDELSTALTDLTKKLNFAYRSQNGPMIHQLQMILESYKAEYNKKMDELMKKQNIRTAVKVEKEGEISSKNS
jgi:hypothetical protein